MNELRMYVELLFEGKVLTADAIELKEEIYGNLVARYEDLLAEGVSEAEALRRTKESMTSIDDVLEEPAAMAESAARAHSADDAPGKRDAAGDAAGTSDSALSPEDGAASVVSGSPVAPSSRRARTGLSRTMKIVIAVLVGLLCLGGLGIWAFVELFGIDEAVESRVEAVEDRVEDKVTGAVEGVQSSVGNDASAELDQSILAVDPAVLASYVGLSVADTNQLTGLIATLPLGADYAQSVAGSAAGDTVSFELANIPDALDDDAVERVLAFDAMALFTVLPEVAQVQIGVQEQGDSAAERDFYVFDRETLEVRCQAFPADHAGGFSPDLLDDATAWSALVKECTSASFYDDVCELAER